MSLNLAFLPDAVSGAIQQGFLEQKMYESLKPLLLWRGLCQQERHPGKIGEVVTKTRSGLIVPGTKASLRIQPGQDPAQQQSSIEQFSYQVASYGSFLDIDLPSDFLAQASRFLDDSGKLGVHAAQSMGRMARDALLAAYGGGNSFATTGATSTALVVKDATGFDTVMLNGAPVAVSVANPLTIALGGVGNVTITACNLATNTLTLSGAQTWAQYATVTRSDAPSVIRQGGRANDHLIVAGDTPTAATYRTAAASMRDDNVPGMDGTPNGLFGCFVDNQTEQALFADVEFHNAIQAQGLTGPFASGAIGDYAGIRFIRNTEMTKLAADADYQATIHRSVMFGAEPIIEAFVPEEAFMAAVQAQGVAGQNHYRMPLDPAAVMTLVIRGALDSLGRRVRASWVSNVDYCIPSDALNPTSAARFKRCRVIHCAGPA